MKREKGVLINLYDDEETVVVLRRHWLAILNSIIIFVILIIFFFVGLFVSSSAINNNQLDSPARSNKVTENLGQGALIVFGSAYILGVLGYGYIAWFDYYLDLLIVTNQRILKVDQAVLFSQKISETSFQHIQNVGCQVRGVVKSVLNVGAVYVETAGDMDNFTFTFMSNPGAISSRILKLQKEMWDREGVKSDLGNSRKLTKTKSIISDFSGNETLVEGAKKTEASPVVTEVVKEDPVNNCMEEDVSSRATSCGNANKDSATNGVIIEDKYYKDGRRITSYGVIWQSSQDITPEVLELLNGADKEKEFSASEW